MLVHHYHFGKEGGAEKFFVALAEGLWEAGVQQNITMRPDRSWEKSVAQHADLEFSNFRKLHWDRVLLPLKVKRKAKAQKPDAIMCWMPNAARLILDGITCQKFVRLGDYPTDLSYLKNIDTIICNTLGIAAHVEKLGWTKPTKVISNFTSVTKSVPVKRSDYDTPDDAFLVCATGRFVKRKGIDVVLKAVGLLENAYLWVCGDGEQNEDLHQLSHDLGIAGRVRFLGWQNNPMPFVAASDAYVAASSHEPFGNVILEAWKQEVPVVSTRSEGPSWFMEGGVDGLMTDIGDYAEIAKKLQSIQADKSLSNTLVAGGLSKLESKFSKQAIVGEYMNAFRTS
ncbi:MAG: glycosyltransferase [Alphaproteobacteria bacterium]